MNRLTLNDIDIIARLSEIEFLPGELFQCVTVGCEHPYTVLHPADFFVVHPDLLFLTADFKAGLYPADDIRSRLEQHQKDEKSRNDRSVSEKSAVGTVEYFTWPFHFLSLLEDFCAKIIIFERFFAFGKAKFKQN